MAGPREATMNVNDGFGLLRLLIHRRGMERYWVPLCA